MDGENIYVRKWLLPAVPLEMRNGRERAVGRISAVPGGSGRANRTFNRSPELLDQLRNILPSKRDLKLHSGFLNTVLLTHGNLVGLPSPGPQRTRIQKTP